MKTFMGLLLFVPIACIRAALWIIGWIATAISLVADGQHHTPRMWKMWADAAATPAAYSTSRWRKYVWWAWRNPTRGLKGVFKQPIPEVQPNPDNLVRPSMSRHKYASRWMSHGIYWEYWYLRKLEPGKYFEFRFGWKFVDGNDEFFPTLQLRIGG